MMPVRIVVRQRAMMRLAWKRWRKIGAWRK